MKLYRTNIVCVLLLLSLNTFASDSLKNNAKLKYYESKIDEFEIPFDLKSAFYDSIIQIYTYKNDKKGIIKSMMGKSKMLYENGEPMSAYNTYKSTLEKIDIDEQNIDLYLESQKKEAMLQMANMSINIAMYDDGMRYLYDLLKYNNDGDLNYSAKSYSLLGVILTNSNNKVSAKEYHVKAMSMTKQIDTLKNSTIFSIYNNYALLFYADNNSDSTLYYLLAAKKYCQQPEDRRLLIHLYINLALTYHDLEEYSIAENYYKDAILIDSKSDLSFNKALVLLSLGELYVEQKKYDEAMQPLYKGLGIASRINARGLMSRIFSVLSELKFEKKDYKQAYEYLVQSKKMNDSIFNSNSMDRMMIMKSSFDADKVKMEKESLEQKLLITELNNQKKNILLMVLLAVIILVTVVVIMLFLKLFKQYKVNTALNDVIHDLHDEEKNKTEEAKKLFENTIEVKNRELTSNALSLMQINEMLSDVKNNFQKLIDSDDDDERTSIAKQINSLFNSSSNDSNWQDFKLYFEQVHQSFFKRLEEAHPDLSSGELKLCALIVLNMNAKEIATITNRAHRSVETFIYRLRKKMNIRSDVKIVTYLRSFLD